MTACNGLKRPTSITCRCGTVVEVKPRGRIPWQCGTCAHDRKMAMQRGEVVPLRPPDFTFDTNDERELGPEHPQYGMSPAEYAHWKAERAVQLYREEPELSVPVIAERLELSVSYVHSLLNRAGIHCRGDGRSQLASGPPP